MTEPWKLRAATIVGLVLFVASLGLYRAYAAQALADGRTDSDLRCLVVSLKMSGSSDVFTRNAGTSAALYYLGRLDGRSAGLDLENEAARVLSNSSQAELQLAGRTCGVLLSSRAQALKALGLRLADKALLPKLPR